MSDFFSRLTNDITVAFEKLGSDFNKATSASKRKETAGKTGIVSEREAGWSSFPEYVIELGPKVRSINCERNSIASLPEDLDSSSLWLQSSLWDTMHLPASLTLCA